MNITDNLWNGFKDLGPWGGSCNVMTTPWTRFLARPGTEGSPGGDYNVYVLGGQFGVMQVAIYYTGSDLKIRANYSGTWQNWTTF